jgi:hypothetical protein
LIEWPTLVVHAGGGVGRRVGGAPCRVPWL